MFYRDGLNMHVTHIILAETYCTVLHWLAIFWPLFSNHLDETSPAQLWMQSGCMKRKLIAFGSIQYD